MKRLNGMGCVTYVKSRRKPYLVYGPYQLIGDTYKRKYIGAFETQKEAEYARAQYCYDPESLKPKIKFKELYEEYEKTSYFTTLSKSSKDGYKAAFKKLSPLYSVNFASIRTGQMQCIIDNMKNEGFSSSSIHKVKVLLTVLYGYAMQNDIVDKNYAEFVREPTTEEKEKRSLTDLEIKKIKNAALKGNETAQWVWFMIHSGWRIGELLELTRFNYNESEKAFTGGKKTAAGKNRIVPVHPDVQFIIDKQLAKKGDTVFCMDSGKRMTTDYFRRQLFKPLLKELKIDENITPHITRHTFATKLKQAGADDLYRKKLLGHASKGITDSVYTHVEIVQLRETILLLEVA